MVETPALGSVPEAVPFKRGILFYDPNAGLARSPFKPGQDITLRPGEERLFFQELLKTGFVPFDFGTNGSMAAYRTRRDIGDTDKENYLIKVRPSDRKSLTKDGGYYLDINHPALEGVELVSAVPVEADDYEHSVNPDEARELLWILNQQDYLVRAVEKKPKTRKIIIQVSDMIRRGQRVSKNIHSMLIDAILALNLPEEELSDYEKEYAKVRRGRAPQY